MGEVKAGIYYATVDVMSADITNIKKEINDLFSNELCSNVINSIAGHYNGDAAESYKNRFKDLGSKANDTLEQVITTMTQKISEEEENYKRQDQALLG